MALGSSVSRVPSEAGRAGGGAAHPDRPHLPSGTACLAPGGEGARMVTFTRRGEREGVSTRRSLSPGGGLWAQWPGPWLKGSFMEAEVLCPDFILAFISLHKHVLSTYCVQAVHCSWPCTHRAAPTWQGPRLSGGTGLAEGSVSQRHKAQAASSDGCD